MHSIRGEGDTHPRVTKDEYLKKASGRLAVDYTWIDSATVVPDTVAEVCGGGAVGITTYLDRGS